LVLSATQDDVTVWGPIPVFDGDDGRPALGGFVGAATMSTNPLLPRPERRRRHRDDHTATVTTTTARLVRLSSAS
jgi:hypothetical protein